jgi:hypothetical protein
MQFVQEKLKAKLPYWTDITADPANCQITFAKHYGPELSANGNSRDYTTTFSFREVERIEVMPLREYSRVTGQEEDPDNPPSPDTFVLRVLMTTAKSVHERKTTSKKGKVVSGPANYNANWNYDKYKGEWTATFQEGEDLANRLAKAMAHAVELCGGGSKPEPF